MLETRDGEMIQNDPMLIVFIRMGILKGKRLEMSVCEGFLYKGNHVGICVQTAMDGF